MKALIVAKYNQNRFVPFVEEQADELKHLGVEIDYFGVVGKGVIGYLKNLRKLRKKIKFFQPNVIHAHYGLSGLLANIQRKIPVVTTYHGSDINNNKVFLLSRITLVLSAYNIFVSEKNRKKSKSTKRYKIIPCGVDLDTFTLIDKLEARHELGLDEEKRLILFSAAFTNKVKNYELAKEVISLLPAEKEIVLLELKGYTRKQVGILMNAVDVVLMTSFTEGSPQFIKEAMACNCPVVSVDVGDVRYIVGDTEECYITSYEPEDIAEKLKKVLNCDKRTNGRERILGLGLDSETVARKIHDIYQLVLSS